MRDAYSLLGQTAEGLPLREKTLRVSEAMAHGFGRSLFLVPLGEACPIADQVADASEFAAQALALAREGGRRSCEASALSLLGDVAARGNLPEHSEVHYGEALVLAEELEMRPLVGYCHFGLGSLFRRPNRRERAYAHLTAHEHVTIAAVMYHEMDLRVWPEQTWADRLQLE